eukprot:gb/GECG01001672.1/.p1 GENE.gb/GECG01001672.1/~~gb/GECG01001672.1/.p1  ORF type:complete len:133 (+),score=6.38 gb/GECG01001672.1/:1-399(+)
MYHSAIWRPLAVLHIYMSATQVQVVPMDSSGLSGATSVAAEESVNCVNTEVKSRLLRWTTVQQHLPFPFPAARSGSAPHSLRLGRNFSPMHHSQTKVLRQNSDATLGRQGSNCISPQASILRPLSQSLKQEI